MISPSTAAAEVPPDWQALRDTVGPGLCTIVAAPIRLAVGTVGVLTTVSHDPSSLAAQQVHVEMLAAWLSRMFLDGMLLAYASMLEDVLMSTSMNELIRVGGCSHMRLRHGHACPCAA